MTGEVVVWLSAQIDEDERVAQACEAVNGLGHLCGWVELQTPEVDVAEAYLEQYPADRMLREVEAKRRRLQRHQPVEVWAGHDHIPAGEPGSRQLLWLECAWCIEDTRPDGDNGPECFHSNRRWPCPDIRDDAAVYADRSGYRDEWRP